MYTNIVLLCLILIFLGKMEFYNSQKSSLKTKKDQSQTAIEPPSYHAGQH